MDKLLRVVIILMAGPLFFIFAAYQYHKGGVWAHTGWTKFSPVEWQDREDAPITFWLTLLSEVCAGIALICIGLFKKRRPATLSMMICEIIPRRKDALLVAPYFRLVERLRRDPHHPAGPVLD